MVAGGCCIAAYPRKTNAPKYTLHPAVAVGHGGMESGDVVLTCPSVARSLTDGYHLKSLPG
ncbi:MAG: hypothetical protein Rhob2KO_17200 [Rhodopirellula baltica]